MLDAIADMKIERTELTIKLWVEPTDNLTCTEKLGAFYESFGFRATGNGSEMELN
jgi:hypothetical protein